MPSVPQVCPRVMSPRRRLRRTVFALLALLVVGLSVGERAAQLVALDSLRPASAWAWGSDGGDEAPDSTNSDCCGDGPSTDTDDGADDGGGDEGDDSGGDGDGSGD